MSECIFCLIAAGKIPAKKIFENERFLAFEDIKPKAQVHVLVIPKHHIVSLMDISQEELLLLGELTCLLPNIAKQCGLDTGFRTIINSGVGGGQEVPHLHYHLLGGRRLPPF